MSAETELAAELTSRRNALIAEAGRLGELAARLVSAANAGSPGVSPGDET